MGGTLGGLLILALLLWLFVRRRKVDRKDVPPHPTDEKAVSPTPRDQASQESPNVKRASTSPRPELATGPGHDIYEAASGAASPRDVGGGPSTELHGEAVSGPWFGKKTKWTRRAELSTQDSQVAELAGSVGAFEVSSEPSPTNTRFPHGNRSNEATSLTNTDSAVGLNIINTAGTASPVYAHTDSQVYADSPRVGPVSPILSATGTSTPAGARDSPRIGAVSPPDMGSPRIRHTASGNPIVAHKTSRPGLQRNPSSLAGI